MISSSVHQNLLLAIYMPFTFKQPNTERALKIKDVKTMNTDNQSINHCDITYPGSCL